MAFWFYMGYLFWPGMEPVQGEMKMAVAVEDYEGNIQVYDKAVKVTDQGHQYVLLAADGSILAIIPKDEVKKLHSDL
ncbi:hypothetical protein [Pseudomonas fluorescens]|nr:hypothetical protein [Pseudomonas fluorescens]MCI4607263.1 hypothetical protein [Pseudomonas fluorescens]PQA99928.1 hypothetical protein B0A76_16415 [Pseudomonas fluorescens]RFP96127.1 hypothetical protein D0N73_11005 [Pseudomonas fluorescens]RMO77233.1 hypothetical protein ALQ35_04966 [Pseudomonas fluorescens]TWR44730.1 hypothetical protein FIP59_24020 [Pseudomonas fluorescens]